jgi:uncharacterized hydrophobic protein (TIGR00271 family)
MKKLFDGVKLFLIDRFNLQEGKADDDTVIGTIQDNVQFTGVNLWALIFAIFIASIGLNVNSTAVIIGAMLISPIMGPIMGIGLGVGINDLTLLKKGAKNLLVATIIGILTSTIYFLISPLHDAQSQLLARTSPSIWDVFIAFFGGGAGMVAASRKEKSNVIPGVAIATALMPPLCTAGFGLATENWLYFFGAMYLYFINSVFIAIATFLMTRYLKMKPKNFEDPSARKKTVRYIIAVVIITIIPSVIMAYQIVEKGVFETEARKFVDEQFIYANTQVVSKSYHYKGKNKSIEVLLIGRELNTKTIDSLSNNLTKYNLKDVHLIIRQGLNARHQIDLSQIKASILEDVFSRIPKPDTIRVKPIKLISKDSEVFAELKVLFPALRTFGVSQIAIRNTKTMLADTQHVAVATFIGRISKLDQTKLESWLKVRYQYPTLKLIVE